MKPFVHKFIHPPLVLGLHGLLLLPLFLAPPDERLQRPPEFLRAHDREYDDEREPLLVRLHPKFSIPFGILGFIGVHILKQLAGKVPLPQDPRRARLAANIEKAVLFALGVAEEVWRWGLARILIKLLGGQGGFRGRGPLWDLFISGEPQEQLFGVVSPDNTKYQSIWEAVYLMGWFWSVLEATVSWNTVRPTSPDELHHSNMHDAHHSPFFGRRSIENNQRRPLLGKRNRSEYSTFVQSDDNSDHQNPVRSTERLSYFESIQHKRRDMGTSPRTRERVGELAIQFLIEGSGSTTAYDSSTTPTTPKAFAKADDMEQGDATPRPLSRAMERPDGISDNDYGDDEGETESDYENYESGLSSRSSFEGRRRRSSEAQTPLLSSSLPYDPEQDHPHHENLLHRQPSLSTLGDHAAAAVSSSYAASLIQRDEEESDELVEVHEDDVGTEPIAVNSSPRRQSIYPSFPSYSSNYNHTHFHAPIPPSSSSATESTMHIRYHNVRRKVYGLSVDRLPVYLAVMWRAAAALRHIGHALWFAWAPNIVFQGKFQWWCFLVLLVLCVRKGWNTVEWFGGSASRAGLFKSSLLLLSVGTTIYVAALAAWGILW
ncbi:hypothetical protein FN846DRAFT_421504 [Sphaerosporella brunnea]|uniref:Uncharacterized protein n=1 Tax=Sphaerosporella brunnea TaxID=1250544 RepID=A0A5J5EG44_9PEZI|nr:hypothetical protein FN846DRAFT_421504 [Sphaerosporella brunnea]